MKSLVVEDEFTARAILQRFLSHHGDCDVAVDGDEAVAAVSAQLQTGASYDLVCLDISLPKLDGRGVLERIRALELAQGLQLGRGCKVIMTTAATGKEHVVGAFREGADAYLNKPINLQALSRELRSLQLLG